MGRRPPTTTRSMIGAAVVAGLAGAPEDLDVHVHAAGLAVRVLVVAEAGAAALDTERSTSRTAPCSAATSSPSA